MFRHVSVLLLLFSLSFFLLSEVSHAKRFGGGRSFGVIRSFNVSSLSKTKSGFLAPLTERIKSKKWLPMLAGVAMGGLLSYFLMSHGFGSGIMAGLLLSGLLLLLYQFFKARTLSYRTAHHIPNYDIPSQQNLTQPISQLASNYFNEVDFLRIAKSHYLRLQAAYDQKNLSDLREFTTPEASVEIQLQFAEREQVENVTEVISLDAKLLDATSQSQGFFATVEFRALLKEEKNSAPTSITEIWHFRQVTDDHWVVTGLEQVQS